jgi:hypothetical protein
MEIRITEVNARDEITIRTLFTNYSFRVTDPGQCLGFDHYRGHHVSTAG